MSDRATNFVTIFFMVIIIISFGILIAQSYQKEFRKEEETFIGIITNVIPVKESKIYKYGYIYNVTFNNSKTYTIDTGFFKGQLDLSIGNKILIQLNKDYPQSNWIIKQYTILQKS